MERLSDMSFEEADKVEDIAARLHERVSHETERILKDQLRLLGIDRPDPEKMKKHLYPSDPKTLCSYEYDGKPILGVRIGPMSVEFDVPKIVGVN